MRSPHPDPTDKAHEPVSAEALLTLLYHELKKLASAKLDREGRPTIQTTELVHEAYLRLNRDHSQAWNGKAHFFGAAAKAMRRILVERARQRKALKRDRPREQSPLETIMANDGADALDILALDEALRKLDEALPRHAAIVQLRFFGGLTITEVARTLNLSTSTVDNDWAYAKAWLRVEIDGRQQ